MLEKSELLHSSRRGNPGTCLPRPPHNIDTTRTAASNPWFCAATMFNQILSAPIVWCTSMRAEGPTQSNNLRWAKPQTSRSQLTCLSCNTPPHRHNLESRRHCTSVLLETILFRSMANHKRINRSGRVGGSGWVGWKRLSSRSRHTQVTQYTALLENNERTFPLFA